MIGYKVFAVFKKKPGQLFPPMVANPGGASTPVGVWLNADAAPRAEDSKTGRPRVQAGGTGTNAGKQTLAYRPGWHLGEVPQANQFNKINPETGEKELFPENFVWAECEFAADENYQQEAESYGYNAAGNFQHSLAGLPKIPVNGFYKYRTNPDPKTEPWFITGAMKVKRILSDEEVNEVLQKNGYPVMRRKGGEMNLEDWGLNKDGSLAADGSDGSVCEQNAANDVTDPNRSSAPECSMMILYHIFLKNQMVKLKKMVIFRTFRTFRTRLRLKATPRQAYRTWEAVMVCVSVWRNIRRAMRKNQPVTSRDLITTELTGFFYVILNKMN